MKIFLDKVVYRFNQPLSELQLNKSNLYIRQYLTEIGVTIIANYGDKIDFKSGLFSGKQTLSRIERGVINITPESLELEFQTTGLVVILVFMTIAITITTHNFFLPIPVATSAFFIHKLALTSNINEALVQLGRTLEAL